MDLFPEEMARVRSLLEAWEVVHLRVHCRGGGDIEAPFAGSLVRGGFGASLYRLVCAHKGIPCATCPLLDRCIYPPLFDRPPGSFRGGAARPFVLFPPESIRTGPLSFEVKLFGALPAAIPYLLLSLVEMGRAGVGRERVKLEVEGIESLVPGEGGPAVVYDPERGILPEQVRRFPALRVFDGDGMGFRSRRGAKEDPRRIALVLRTPLRMKEGGRIRSGLAPRRLISASLRRLSDLGAAQGQSWPRAWPGTLAASRSMTLERQSVRWLDWGRYSRRQESALRLGGAVGRLEYGGVAPGILALLRAASFAHLGKNAAFGLGAIDLIEMGEG